MIDFLISNALMEERHAGHHHTVNVKCGYISLGISLAYFLILATYRRYLFIRNGFTSPSKILPIWCHLLIWAIVVVIFTFNTSLEYSTIIKRFGRLSFSLVPFNILLVIRPNIISYGGIIGLHKWISRFIILLATVHGIGFYYKWFSEEAIIVKLFKLLNLLGIIALVLLGFLVLLSIYTIRRVSYRTFYVYHNIAFLSFIVMVFFHARPGVPIETILSFGLLVLQIFFRFFTFYRFDHPKVVAIHNSNLQIIEFKLPNDYPSWTPGSHIRLSSKKNFFFPSHPFTIASESSDSVVKLILNRPNQLEFNGGESYNISAPFPIFSPKFFDVSPNSILVSGGSGISFALPVYLSLKRSGATAQLVWISRSKDDILVLENVPFQEDIMVFITQTVTEDPLELEEDNIELDSIESGTEALLPSVAKESVEKSYSIKMKKPILSELLSNILTDKEALQLIACGSLRLVGDCQKWAKSNKVSFVSEVYEM